MKKLFFIMVMIISTCITIYAIMFWQPSETVISENKINQIEFGSLSDEINKVDSINKEKKDSEDYDENRKNNNESLSIENDKVIEVVSQDSILKFDEKEIENLINKEDKEKIEIIIKNISEVDLINIKEKFAKENKLEGFREGFALIERRISVKDYEEIKKILSEYIDFTILEMEV